MDYFKAEIEDWSTLLAGTQWFSSDGELAFLLGVSCRYFRSITAMFLYAADPLQAASLFHRAVRPT